MTIADVLASFVDALIGGLVVISTVVASRAVSRERRLRRFANRRFMQLQRDDPCGPCPTANRFPVPSSRRLVVQLSALPSNLQAPASSGEQRGTA
jgi:hypothetical protein